ncbi:RAB7A-interacting MON1-CCZ1 complex subunit 1 [Pelobates fuscus]|uniref:RAB7A-interacting MON1-CCZ1 complex subunit 1 n=1 Tax=Pelobates fuscus TaxID=191477 RepID=UPI002FE4538C
MAASSSSIWKQKVDLLQHKCESLCTRAGDDPILRKAKTTLQKLKDLSLDETEKFDISCFLNLYSKAILDITFYEENQLVDEDFVCDDALQKVGELIRNLSEPERLARDAKLHKKAPVIEVEVLECLYWRRGALLYMYCQTVGERECWHLRNPKTFQQCLSDGVSHLMKMLKMQSPLVLNEDVSFQDLNTATLLSEGIFSDTHVLALMYCGEMCYWGLKYCSDSQSSNTGPENGDRSQDKLVAFKDIGENVLETYISVCEGPLISQGWKTEKAKTILQFLKH